MRFNIKEVLEKADRDFEAAWAETGRLVGGRGAFQPNQGRRGAAHVLSETANRLREAYLELGFDEVVNPMTVDEADLYKQYGNEAPAILDRCYYLATRPRPDIGIGAEKVEEMRRLGAPTDEEALARVRGVFHDYKKGKVDGDDLVERLTEGMGVPDTLALKVMNEVFPELRRVEAQPTKMLLRSHITSAWFQTCLAVQHKLEMPVKLFCVGLRARREQQEDASHLRFHNAASSVIMDDEVSVDDGSAVAELVLRRLGFQEVRTERKRVTAKYYAPGTEHEVFARSEKAGWVELMDFGLYSPVALARYGIEHPVLNIGMGVERIAMLLNGYSDIREMAYPQFYGEWILSDAALARQISFIEEPGTAEGREVERAIVRKVEEMRGAGSPCEFVAFEGRVGGRAVRVKVFEPDPNVKLVGPAAFNELVVYDGNILGIPEEGMEGVELIRNARSKGIRTGVRYLDAVAKMAAARVERDGRMEVRTRMAKLPSDINIRVSDVGVRYVSSRHGKIDVRGPAFVGVYSEVVKE